MASPQSNNLLSNSRTQPYGGVDANQTAPEVWISQIIPSVMSRYVPTSTSDKLCQRHGQLYKEHLSNMTLWAVQMLDASVLSLTGILSSSGYNFGAFDECIQIRVPNHSINGKYCIISLTFAPTQQLFPYFYEEEQQEFFTRPTATESVWKLVKKTKDPRIKHRDIAHWAVCVPASCSADDIVQSLSKQLLPMLKTKGINGTLKGSESLCRTLNDDPDPPVGLFIYLALILMLFTLVFLISLYEIFLKGKVHISTPSNKKPWYYQFSMATHMYKLTRFEAHKDFQFLAGFKVLSMFMIIYGHRLLTALYAPLQNPEDYENKFGQFFETFNFNGAIVVNTFFLISGFLTFNKIISDIQKRRTINPILYIYYRWLRVTPVYLFVIFFIGLVMPYADSGPFNKVEGSWRHQNCLKNWWTHALYINNYYRTEEECLIPGWYLAADMQLFVVSVFVGFIYSKSKKVAHVLISLLFTASLVIPMLVTYYGGYNAIIKFYLTYLKTYYKEEDYVNTYTRTHMRASPYIIGMITAIIYWRLKEQKVKFTKCQMIFGTLLGIIVALTSHLYAWVYFIPTRKSTAIENALYSSLHKVFWAGSFAWFIIAQATTGYGMMSGLVSHRFYAPLNKLSLCALLVHTPMQIYLFIKQRNTYYLDQYNTIWMAAGDILLSYLLALGVHLVIEAPFSGLNDLFLRKMIASRKEKIQEVNQQQPTFNFHPRDV